MIGQVLRRSPHVAGKRYNERVLDLNELLKTPCESSDLNIDFIIEISEDFETYKCPI